MASEHEKSQRAGETYKAPYCTVSSAPTHATRGSVRRARRQDMVRALKRNVEASDSVLTGQSIRATQRAGAVQEAAPTKFKTT